MNTPVNYLVNPLPTAVSQGNSNLCWLAATAVMDSFKASSPVSMTDAAVRLGGIYVLKQNQGTALNYNELDNWLFVGGFKREGQQSLSASGWETLLMSHGPLITLVDGNGTGTINHAVVVVGISGDGTSKGTTISFADGNSGSIRNSSLFAFATTFELPGGSDTLFSVGYFKS